MAEQAQMTDKEKLLKLLTEFGVGYEDKGPEVVCESGSGKVIGYAGFYTVFHFDGQGRFTNMGAFE